ncbi:DNA sulfur modification protein DndB [Streptomyces syringium]|uniref:DNA sulfur modification protein DndB n=1 Tax=Streptomyces syringium TaxID=76729 RepID=UPI003404F0C4
MPGQMGEFTAIDTVAASIKGDVIRLPAKFEAIGFLSTAGVMQKVSFVMPFRAVAERLTFERLLDRHDFDAESLTTPGQRDLSQSHADKIAGFLQQTERPYLGSLTIAIDEGDVEVHKLLEVSPNVWLVKLAIPSTSENPIIEDGQHRVKGLTQAWNTIMEDAKKLPEQQLYASARSLLEASSIEITLLLESDPSVLSTIFVKMASTRPISPSLIAIMDSSAVQNRLGQMVTRSSRFLADRTSYLSAGAARKLASAKGREYDPLYPAAAVRSAAAAIAGVGVRDRSPDQREGLLTAILERRARDERRPFEHVLTDTATEVAELIDYAANRLPGWKQMLNGSMTASEFKGAYVHSAAAGLHVVANVIAVARESGLDPRPVIDALASAPWSRYDLRESKHDGEDVQVHALFENTLASTAFDSKTGTWKAGTGGATRTSYEAAIRDVLDWLVAGDRAFTPLGDKTVLQRLGLIGGRVGRPRKALKKT